MIFSLLVSLLLAPQADTLLQKRMERASAVDAVLQETRSAAAFLWSPVASYTEAGISWRQGACPDPAYIEEGKGLGEGRLDIVTLVRLARNQAVRGSVQYLNGRRSGVLWNSGSDFHLVYPYAVADTVGGDVQREQYAFSGAYARRIGRFHLGAEGQYRALHEYRMVDPRPRSIVSDLQIRLSGGCRLTESYVLDATLGYRRYGQSQTLSFYNQRGNNSSIFHLTGLGSHFARFAGGTDAYLTTRYAGNGAQVILALLPLRPEGWKAALSYQVLDIRHHLPNQNEAPYTESITQEVNLQAAWIGGGDDFRWSALAHGGYRPLTGIETVLDNGRAGSMRELLHFAMFHARGLEAGLEARVEKGPWRASLASGWENHREEYSYPLRRMQWGGVKLQMEAACLLRTGSWLLHPRFQAGRHQSFGGISAIPAEYTLKKAQEHLEGRFSRLSDSNTTLGAAFRADHPVGGRVALFAALNGQILLRDHARPAYLYSITLGCNF